LFSGARVRRKQIEIGRPTVWNAFEVISAAATDGQSLPQIITSSVTDV